MAVSVVIPAYNEASRIGATVRAVWAVPEVKEVLVVDDGSRDETAALAAAAGAKVISFPFCQGKGKALTVGAREAAEELVAFLDADLGETARELEKLLFSVKSERAEMAVALFPPSSGAGLGLAKGLARLGLFLFTGLSLKAPLSGQRVLPRWVLPFLFPLPAGFGFEVGLTLKAHRLGLRLEEVPVEMRHRQTGLNLKGFLHRGRQFFAVGFVLLAWRGRCFLWP